MSNYTSQKFSYPQRWKIPQDKITSIGSYREIAIAIESEAGDSLT